MVTRILSEEEVIDLRDRHFWNFLWNGSKTRFIEDEVYGVVLVFTKEDGTTLVIATDLASDPGESDPNAWIYVVNETLKAAGQAAGGLVTGGSDLAKTLMTLGVMFLAWQILKEWKK